ncbi:MAG TPA: DoxX family protein [Mizugakiibacter sp.]|nr:DoxX family protein [Mizugakiibacter sp.]
MRDAAQLIGRVLLAQAFIIAAIDKIVGYAGTAHYMAAYGVPTALLPLVIALELGVGVALLLGWHTRLAALILALFSLVAAVIFHHQIAEPMQLVLLMGDLAFAGGLLVVSAVGGGRLSLDAHREPATSAAPK